MGSISPVIAAFLQGQHGQTSMLQEAHNIINQREQRKLQREQLEAAIKQHGVENQREQAKLDLELEQFGLQHKLAMINHENTIREQFAKGTRTPEGTNFQIPGMQTVQPSAPGTPLDITSGVPSNIFTPNQTQAVDTPLGPMNVSNIDTPEMQRQSHIQDILATIPALVAQTTAVEGVKHKYGLENIQTKIDAQDEIHKAQIRMMERGQDMRMAQATTVAEMNGMAKTMQMLMNAGLPPDKGALQGAAATAASQMALGTADKKDFHPLIGNLAENMMTAAGHNKVPKDTYAKVNDMANSAVTLQNDIDNLVQNVHAPLSTGSKIANVLAEHTGISGLSPYKSTYDAFIASNLPRLDVAVGLTPGALSRSPKLMDKLKSMLPLPADSPKIIAEKQASGLDIYLSSINGKLLSVSPDQRKLFWKDIHRNNPDLMKNKLVGDKIIKAEDTGLYTPGSLYQSLLEGR